MFDWLTELFGDDALSTIANGASSLGSVWDALAPFINSGAQIAGAIDGYNNAEDLKEANKATMDRLDAMFSPTSEYAQELRNQVERKDAAAGRRSQYGPRETNLMAQLTREKANVLTSPLYQMYMTGANRGSLGPILGAIGNMLGGGSQTRQPGGGGGSNPLSGASSAKNLIDLFGGLGGMSGPAGLGGAAAALGSGLGGLSSFLSGGSSAGTMLGSQLGLGGIFGGSGAGAMAPTIGADALGSLSALFGGGAGSGAAGGGAASGLGGVGGGLASLGWALPAAGLIAGVANMFQPGTDQGEYWHTRKNITNSDDWDRLFREGQINFTPNEGESLDSFRQRARQGVPGAEGQWNEAWLPNVDSFYNNYNNYISNKNKPPVAWWNEPGNMGD